MRSLAIAAGKGVAFAITHLSLGGGTALPGLVAERLHPPFVPDLASRLRCGSVLVTGTNGKTTTARMLATVLETGGLSVLGNEEGSNLRRGIASSLVRAADLSGRLHSDVAVFEIDEATMRTMTPALRPGVVVVTNLARDQLDRYGELESVAAVIRESLAAAPGATLVLNADDPLVAGLASSAPGRVVFFGLDATHAEETQASSCAAPETTLCPSCGTPLGYEVRFFGSLGLWHCPRCGLSRPRPDVAASRIASTSRNAHFELRWPAGEQECALPVGGLHNVYNALAAAAVAAELGVTADALGRGFAAFTPAFGRMETLRVRGRRVMLQLVKNPVALTQSLATSLAERGRKRIALVLNDNAADGRDVSWTWDAQLERLDLSECSFVASGTRAEDMALRLKYAGVPSERLSVEPRPVPAVEMLVRSAETNEHAFVLPTYTAMLEIRNAFAGRAIFGALGRAARFGA